MDTFYSKSMFLILKVVYLCDSFLFKTTTLTDSSEIHGTTNYSGLHSTLLTSETPPWDISKDLLNRSRSSEINATVSSYEESISVKAVHVSDMLDTSSTTTPPTVSTNRTSVSQTSTEKKITFDESSTVDISSNRRLSSTNTFVLLNTPQEDGESAQHDQKSIIIVAVTSGVCVVLLTIIVIVVCKIAKRKNKQGSRPSDTEYADLNTRTQPCGQEYEDLRSGNNVEGPEEMYDVPLNEYYTSAMLPEETYDVVNA